LLDIDRSELEESCGFFSSSWSDDQSELEESCGFFFSFGPDGPLEPETV
jgi:hypothetical protein